MADSQQQALELKNKGNAFFAQGKHADAIQAFSQAIALDPNNHILYSNRAASYLLQQQYEKALEDAEATVKLSPQFAKGYLRKATALLYLKRFKEAVDAFGVVLELDASNQQAQTGKQQAALGLKVATAVPDGCWGQLVAPFAPTAPHNIKYDSIGRACDWLFDRGSVGIISTGPASEMNKLSSKEYVELAQSASTHLGSRLPTASFADISISDIDALAEHIKQLQSAGAAAVLLPLQAPFFDKSITKEKFVTKLENLGQKLLPNVILGLVEMSNQITLNADWFGSVFAAAPGHLGIFVDHSGSLTQISNKIQALPPQVKAFTATLSNLLESWNAGSSGYIGTAGAFFPHLLQWMYSHRHDTSSPLATQRVQMTSKFFSVAELTVQKHFPINAKMFLRISGDPAFETLDIVTRQQQHGENANIGEEDIVRLNHLHELVVFVYDSFKDEKISHAKRDSSTLL